MDGFAVISDIHSNIEALEAVLGDIERRGIRRIFCLGDIVGYGPNPKECMDLIAERCEVVLCGNHDHAVIYEPYGFHIAAENASYWTRDQLELEQDRGKRDGRWDVLGGMRPRYQEDGFLFVHGSPRKPINEYLFAEDVYTNPAKLMSNFERVGEQVCFVGHTHIPGIFVDEPYFDLPEELPEPSCFRIGQEKAIINVGSVGQPRDRNVRSSYVTVEDGCVYFHRVDYDIEACVRKIMDIPELDDYLGQRLYDGR